MHKRSEILPAGRPHCLRLADGEPFQEPAQLLARKRPYLRSIARPLEFSIIKAFCAERKSCLIEIQGLKGISFPSAEQVQCICIGIHLISVADDGHKAVEAAPHVCASGDDIDLCVIGQCP